MAHDPVTITSSAPTRRICVDPRCPRDSLAGAPIPICIQHAAELMAWINTQVSLSARKNGKTSGAALTARIDHGDQGLVYYLQVGKLIKIGTTTNLRSRLKGYPPNRRLLATEPGGTTLEATRCAQFAAHRATGREWFHATAILLDHIDGLRRKAGAPPLHRLHITRSGP